MCLPFLAFPCLSHGGQERLWLSLSLWFCLCPLMRSWCFFCGCGACSAPLPRPYPCQRTPHSFFFLAAATHQTQPASALSEQRVMKTSHLHIWSVSGEPYFLKVAEKHPHTSSGRSFPDALPPAPESKSVCLFLFPRSF